MLITLLAWIYITFLCWTWGQIVLYIFNRFCRSDLFVPHFSIICLAGLSMITAVAGFLSLFFPLGEWWVQLIFLIPALYFLLLKINHLEFPGIRKIFSGFHPLVWVLLCMLLLMILVMSTWTIVHPDTLGYHAQTIQWIEKYKVVPGLVHLHVRFGYQGMWFVDNALFGFSFTGVSGITFLNSSVLVWFLIFITRRINDHFSGSGKKLFGLFWIAFLILACWSYTQVRLTATSASPDFIAAIYFFVIIYLLITQSTDFHFKPVNLLIILFCLAAVTIKLSTAPVLIIVMAMAFPFRKGKNSKPFLAAIILSLFVITPFITRNIISSGYIIFPSPATGIAETDWKYSKEQTENEKNYITAYAKKQGVVTKEEIDTVNEMSLTAWVPAWWNQRSLADKTILTLYIISFIISVIFTGKFFRKGNNIILATVTLLAAVLFWFFTAPDPRFGFGQIMGFTGLTAFILFSEKEIYIRKFLVSLLLIIITGAAAYYTIYRFRNFYNKDQWLWPSGIKEVPYLSTSCNGQIFNMPESGNDFGITPVPCTDRDCSQFEPRGSRIEDGFRAAKTP